MATEESSAGGARREGWHVGREVSIAVLFTLVLQTGGGIWWLAQVSSKIDYAVAQLQQFQNERYTREDARRDKELIVALIESQRARDQEHDRRLTALENHK